MLIVTIKGGLMEQKMIWQRSGKAISEGGIIKEIYAGKIDNYNPFDLPNLPNAFSKIHDESTAVIFVTKYGLLGYSWLVDIGKRVGGDPLWWVLAHAESIRFVLNLIAALSKNDDDAILKTLNTARVKSDRSVLSEEIKPIEGKGILDASYKVAVGPYNAVIGNATFAPTEEGKLKVHANYLIVKIVNENIKDITWNFHYDDSVNKIKPYFRVRALITAIWKMTGDMALISQETKGKGIRICDECERPFLVTDKRQRFCPPDRFSKTSLCGSRHRMENYRNKKGVK